MKQKGVFWLFIFNQLNDRITTFKVSVASTRMLTMTRATSQHSAGVMFAALLWCVTMSTWEWTDPLMQPPAENKKDSTHTLNDCIFFFFFYLPLDLAMCLWVCAYQPLGETQRFRWAAGRRGPRTAGRCDEGDSAQPTLPTVCDSLGKTDTHSEQVSMLKGDN